VTPDSESPDPTDRATRPSLRALALGSAGVLVAGAAVAVAGFLAGGGTPAAIVPQAASLNTQHGQLDTYALHDEKPMRAIAKGVAGEASSSATPTPTPTP
jgi:ferric-dicitrate binding protein FerR (iron transport regulator)